MLPSRSFNQQPFNSKMERNLTIASGKFLKIHALCPNYFLILGLFLKVICDSDKQLRYKDLHRRVIYISNTWKKLNVQQ